ncbi:unnamed protein product [Spirodela intermedia]|uniref:Uncharacterized protein n=1 Tax=Spirodela intermedia TaxID=51605 RepID=A0A7I8J9H4_SPIIN|nr:unnamed protein product [Spirodela intermedia]CAA6666102.1 unnamed protein product [Spirodela intermedia]
MGESSGSVSIDIERISLGGSFFLTFSCENFHKLIHFINFLMPVIFTQEHIVQTSFGLVSVVIYGDQDKPALITYPDIALNREYVLFPSTIFCPEVSSLLLHNFCIYHISPPGHELGAAPISSDVPVPSVDDLADQVSDVLNFFGLHAVMCLGVTGGAYVLTLFAMKFRERVLGLILVSPLCKAPSWTEWLYNKVMANLLYFYGMCGLVKECLLQRYFSKDARIPESNLVKACRSLLDERQSINVWRFLQADPDIRGESSPFHSEALYMATNLDRRYSALVEVQSCGSLVTEEQADAMLVPMEFFLMGYGLYRPARLSGSPRSPLSPSCISPELLSPESMGLKLKPIKTRVSLQV